MSDSFREDGALAVDWVASYLERVRDLPVLSQVEPGAIRAALPASPPDEPESVRRGARRSRPGAHARADALAAPALVRVLRDHRLGALDPRGDPDRRPEPARDPLAHLACAAGARGGDPRRGSRSCSACPPASAARSRTRRRRARSSRSQSRARRRPIGVSCCAPSRRTRPSPRRRSCSSSSCGRCRSTSELRLRPELLELDDACAVVATVGTTAFASVDPVDAIADACAAAGVWLHVDAAYAGSAAICPELRHHFAGWERADSIVVNPHKWLGVTIDCSTLWTRHARRFPRHLQPRARVPARRRGRREHERVHAGARPSLPRAQAVGRSPLLRPRRLAGADPRAPPTGGALRGLGTRTSRAGRSSPTATSRSCASGARARTRTTSGSSSASTAPARRFSRTRSSASRFVLRLAVGNFRTTEDDVRIAWDVLRREAAAL